MVTARVANAIADRPLSACVDEFIAAIDVMAYCDRMVEVFELRSTRGRIGALCNAIVATECARVAADDTRTVVGGIAFLDAVLVCLRDRLTDASNRRIARVAGRRA